MIVGVVTTHNEADTIVDLIHGLWKHCDRVIVVDEDSSDRTTSLAEGSGASVLRRRGGIGPCLMAGWNEALNSHPFKVVQIDAGGSHDPVMIETMLRSDASLVIGSRFCRGGLHEGPGWRATGSRASPTWMNVRYHRHIHDWTSGYRVFAPWLLKACLAFPYETTMHSWQAEVLARVVSLNAKIEEVPICYTPSVSSLSMKGVWDAVKVAV